MDLQNSKSIFDTSFNTLLTKNCNVRKSKTPDQQGECSGRTKNRAQTTINDIIKKYKDNKLSTKYTNQKLNKKMSEHALLDQNSESTHSFHTFYNYVEPKYFSNKNKHISGINSDVINTNRILNEDVRYKVTFKEQNNVSEQRGLTSREKLHVDKTTYCRPVAHLYNEEFIYKTMERNARLKRLAKKLAIARQREKENVNWNNFINELKNKHGPSWNGSQWTHRPQFEREKYITPEIIDDYYNTRFSWQQSGPCSNLLQDLYEGFYVPPQPTYYSDRQPHENKSQSYSNHYSVPYNINSYCYPTASQGRLIMLDRERQRSEYLNKCNSRFSNNNSRYVNDDINNNFERHLANKLVSRNSFTNRKCITKNSSATIQTDNKYTNEQIFKNKATNKTESFVIDRLIQTYEFDGKNTGKSQTNNENTTTLMIIEKKLETLIDCVNSFITEIKTNRSKRKTKPTAVDCEFNKITNKKTNTEKSNTRSVTHTECTNQLFCGEILNASSESTIATSAFYPCAVPKQSEIDELLNEIDKLCSKDRLHTNQPCSVNITFEIPTRDCSTEVTKSLSRQQADDEKEVIEEISNPARTSMQQMTIAVNTDPFNFLTLLRISTEALMRLLSNVPTINYHSYLGLLPLPQATRKVETDFICNICGAAFTKPSALSDHIRAHDLGKPRDCSVCRHVLSMSRWPAHLFRCRVCGQRFTRAYCCELHQRTCGRREGSTRDVPSSLVLLT